MKTLSMILIFGLVFPIFTGTVYADDDTGKFYGEVKSMPESDYVGLWIVNGRKVLVTENTVIEEKHGRASAGAFAEIKGLQSGDMFDAYKIEIKQSRDFRQSAYPGKFYGTVEKLPEKGWQGIWIINSREILVTGRTEIEEEYDRAAVGAYVKVEGNYTGERFTAYEIEVKGVKKYSQDKPRRDISYNSKFSGVIESMPQHEYEGLWIVDGRQVRVNNKTLIDETGGAASKGAYAKVKGVRRGNTITANVIVIINKQK